MVDYGCDSFFWGGGDLNPHECEVPPWYALLRGVVGIVVNDIRLEKFTTPIAFIKILMYIVGVVKLWGWNAGCVCR